MCFFQIKSWWNWFFWVVACLGVGIKFRFKPESDCELLGGVSWWVQRLWNFEDFGWWMSENKGVFASVIVVLRPTVQFGLALWWYLLGGFFVSFVLWKCHWCDHWLLGLLVDLFCWFGRWSLLPFLRFFLNFFWLLLSAVVVVDDQLLFYCYWCCYQCYKIINLICQLKSFVNILKFFVLHLQVHLFFWQLQSGCIVAMFGICQWLHQVVCQCPLHCFCGHGLSQSCLKGGHGQVFHIFHCGHPTSHKCSGEEGFCESSYRLNATHFFDTKC